MLSWFQKHWGALSLTHVPKFRERTVVHTVQASTGPRNANPGNGNYFEALRGSKDRTDLPATAMSAAGAWVRTMYREQLAALGQYLYDNNGTVSYAVNLIQRFSVPIKPKAASGDAEYDKLQNDLWEVFERTADFTGRFHMDTIQGLMCRAMDNHGDIFVTITAESGFPQVQVTEGCNVNSKYISGDSGKAQSPDGVQIDSKGRVEGYWKEIVEFKNGAWVAGDAEFMEFNSTFHLYDPDRYTSYRGMSPIRRGSNDVRDCQDIKGFTKLATKIGASLAAVIETDGPIEEDVWGNDTGNESVGGTDEGNPAKGAVEEDEEATEQEKKMSVAELLGGDIPVIEKGKLHQLNNNNPGANTVDFLGTLGGFFVLGLDLPPAFFLDEKLTGPNARGVNLKAQSKFDQRQETMARFISWAWPRVMAWYIDAGILPPNPNFAKHTWQGPAAFSIDVERNNTSDREDVFSGLMSRQTHAQLRRGNWLQEVNQSFAEDDVILAKARAQADKWKVSIDLILSRWGFGKANVPPSDGEEKDKSDGGDKKDKGKEEKK